MLTIILITGTVILAAVLWKYQRQMKDICRQIAFLREHDSNMLITTQIRAGGVGELAEELNELLLEMKSEHREYMEKEERLPASTRTCPTISARLSPPWTGIFSSSGRPETRRSRNGISASSRRGSAV